MLQLSIIIPVYNEEKTIVEVLKKVASVQLPMQITKQIIVIDDASTDHSSSEIEKFQKLFPALDLIYHQQPANKGKGYAVRTGITYAKGQYLIIQDADLELDPQDYNILIEKALHSQADMVYGSRFIRKQNQPIPLLTVIANRFLSLVTSLLTGIKITDMETCYKLIKRTALDKITLCEDRFGFEPEITIKLLKIRGIRFAEVPITYHARTRHQGKKIGLSDGIRALYCLIRYRFYA
jgi:glycosyltransferase involved in cell wall biosynthesis